MAGQLDILALEPFYGGVRRVMLDTLIRGSRHRWTLLKLPPRRIERRLTAAAHWFAEQLSRHWVGHVDLLFTSEVLNLADLRRLMPQLAPIPSVVYFHSNQLPLPNAIGQTPTDLINLNSATAANEIWFNSQFHLTQFLSRAESLVRRHNELTTRSPMPDLRAKARILPPPIDLSAIHSAANRDGQRSTQSIFLNLAGADFSLLNDTFQLLLRRGEDFRVIAMSNWGLVSSELSSDVPVTYVDETDDVAVAAAMKSCGVYLGGHSPEICDHHCIRALTAGCWPMVPAGCGYEEILPASIHATALYELDPEVLAGQLQDVFHLEQLSGFQGQQEALLNPYDPATACKRIDERLLKVASTGAAMANR